MSSAIISANVKGSYKKTYDFLNKCEQDLSQTYLESIGLAGVEALSAGTPVDSGKTASSWRYEIHSDATGVTIEWHNDNVTKDGHIVALLLQYGHQTKNGTWVYGRDYINPSMAPIFDKMADKIWNEVVNG